MKTILVIFLFFSCQVLYSQEDNFIINDLPSEFANNKDAVLVFLTYTEQDARKNGLFWRNTNEYNEYVVKYAKSYTGQKKILTETELKADPEGINYVFKPVVIKTDGFRKWPAGFGILEISSGKVYTKIGCLLIIPQKNARER
jgi:hypothetical protein